jgi:A/G-specific adenine glycosylase
MVKISAKKVALFRRRIFAFYRKHGRQLWFRDTTDPYKIAVSEIMLQQTPVERVMAYYPAWIKRWPDWPSLAKASNREVLAAWSGMGYNRRALYLKQLAQVVVTEFGGKLPDDPHILRKLPGIGPYTANAISVFAFSKRLAAVDTNVRKVIRHEFNLPLATPSKEIERIATLVLPRRKVKEWHHALMDYVRLELRIRTGENGGGKKQTRYEGSRRQIRGVIIRQLTVHDAISIKKIARELRRSKTEIESAALAMQKEGIVKLHKGILTLR